MTYNDSEYAIVTALGLNLKGTKAIEYIKSEFGIELNERTYWRYYSRLVATFPAELENLTKNVIEKHLARLHLFYNIRQKLIDAIEKEEDPTKQSRIIAVFDKHEVLTSQLESLSRKYYEKNVKEKLAQAYEALPLIES